MIDDKKIEEIVKQHAEGAFISETWQACYKEGFMDCARWMQEEFLKDLWHPASEVPQIGRGRVLAYSIDCCYRNLYNLYDMMSKTDCNTYQEMWELEVKAYDLDGWIYADELFGLIIEGGNHD